MVGNSGKCHREVKQATLQNIPCRGPPGVHWGQHSGVVGVPKAGGGEEARTEPLPPVSRASAVKGTGSA